MQRGRKVAAPSPQHFTQKVFENGQGPPHGDLIFMQQSGGMQETSPPTGSAFRLRSELNGHENGMPGQSRTCTHLQDDYLLQC
jgi:hypothetical protein